MTFAIIGAGMAGLSCAAALKASGHTVRLFDKGRGPGGRMSTRRMETPIGEVRWDHGAQFFTARDERFQRAVSSWIDQGAVAEWNGDFVEINASGQRHASKLDKRYVGVPGMNGVIKHMASDQSVEWSRRAQSITGSPNKWHIEFEDSSREGPFSNIIVAVPAEQATDLLKDVAPSLAAGAASVRSAPCWAVMLAFDAPLECGFDAVKISEQPLSWVARNVSKPHREAGETWVLHASPLWSRAHVNLEKEDAAALLIKNFRDIAGGPDPVFSAAHRWLYAMIEKSAEGAPFGWDDAASIGACGDWYIAPRVEAAWLSGAMLADGIKSS